MRPIVSVLMREVAHHERSGDREGAALRIAERHPAQEQCDETPASRDAADVDGDTCRRRHDGSIGSAQIARTASTRALCVTGFGTWQSYPAASTFSRSASPT